MFISTDAWHRMQEKINHAESDPSGMQHITCEVPLSSTNNHDDQLQKRTFLVGLIHKELQKVPRVNVLEDGLHMFVNNYWPLRDVELEADHDTRHFIHQWVRERVSGYDDVEDVLLKLNEEDLDALVLDFIHAREQLTDDDVDVLRSMFFQAHSVSQMHIDSYNHMLEHQIPAMVRMLEPIILHEDQWNPIGDCAALKEGKVDLKTICNVYNLKYEESQRGLVIKFLEYLATLWQPDECYGPREHRLEFHSVRYGHAHALNDVTCSPITPLECVLTNRTYVIPVYLDTTYTITDKGSGQVVRQERGEIRLVRLPCLTHTKYCSLYGMSREELLASGENPDTKIANVIINGLRKVIIAQERIVPNHTFMWSVNRGRDGKYKHLRAECRSTREKDLDGGSTTCIYMMQGTKGTILQQGPYTDYHFVAAHMPRIDEELPVYLIFAAYGVVSFREIEDMVVESLDPDSTLAKDMRKVLQDSWYEFGNRELSQDEALAMLQRGLRTRDSIDTNNSSEPAKEGEVASNNSFGNSDVAKPKPGLKAWDGKGTQRDCLLHLMKYTWFPHIGRYCSQTITFRRKVRFLAHTVRRVLLAFLEKEPCDERNYWGNKRIIAAGELLTTELRFLVFKSMACFKNRMRSFLKKRQPISLEALRYSVDNTSDLIKMMNNGSWKRRIGKTGSEHRSDQQSNGICHPQDNTNIIAEIEQVRKSDVMMDRSGNALQSHQLATTSWGCVCIANTPENSGIGHVKHVAQLTLLSAGIDDQHLVDVMEHNLKMIMYDVADRPTQGNSNRLTMILLNGEPVGYTDHPYEFYQGLRRLRMGGYGFDTISIHPRVVHIPSLKTPAKDTQDFGQAQQEARRKFAKLYADPSITDEELYIPEIAVWTESGRELRPLFPVFQDQRIRLTHWHMRRIEQNKNISWHDLVRWGIVEYIDNKEAEVCLIATHPHMLNTPDFVYRKRIYVGYVHYDDYTHSEITPSSIIGLALCMKPATEHNQSPRNTYNCAMAKQELQAEPMWYEPASCRLVHHLVYPQTPLWTGDRGRVIPYVALTCQSVWVAVACFDQMEDALILRRGALDCGFARTLTRRTYQTTVRSTNHEREECCIPPLDAMNRKLANYEHLDADGLVRPGTRVVNDDMRRDVLVGKTIFRRTSNLQEQQQMQQILGRKDLHLSDACDNSMLVAMHEQGVVTSVLRYPIEHGLDAVKVEVSEFHTPELGDKFTTDSAQKCTVTAILPDEDFPFCPELGISPVAIINPLAQPSRMTCSQKIEGYCGTAAALEGVQYVKSLFCNEDYVSRSREVYRRNGLPHDGAYTMVDGRTGEMMDARIFSGFITIKALRHLVRHKWQARGNGGVITSVTKTAPRGKSRGGSVKCGDMELSVLLGHGAAYQHYERTQTLSNCGSIVVCNWCCKEATEITDPETGIKKFVCLCDKDNATDFSNIPAANSSRVLNMEFMTAGVVPRILVNPQAEDIFASVRQGQILPSPPAELSPSTAKGKKDKQKTVSFAPQTMEMPTGGSTFDRMRNNRSSSTVSRKRTFSQVENQDVTKMQREQALPMLPPPPRKVKNTTTSSTTPYLEALLPQDKKNELQQRQNLHLQQKQMPAIMQARKRDNQSRLPFLSPSENEKGNPDDRDNFDCF